MTRAHLRRQAALGIAAVVLVGLCAAKLFTGNQRISGLSGATPAQFIAEVPARGGLLCQTLTGLPDDANLLQMTIGTFGGSGPELRVSYQETRAAAPVRVARLAAGWTEGRIDIPTFSRARDLGSGNLCIRATPGTRLAFAGQAVGPPAQVGSAVQPGRVSIYGLSSGKPSTASLLGELGRRIGYGGAPILGLWTIVLIALVVVLSLGLGGVAIATTEREPASSHNREGRDGRLRVLSRIPAAGKSIFGASLAIGIAWALLIPPFQVADETSHFAYVQYFAETGNLPRESAAPPYSPAENSTLEAIGFGRIIGRPSEKAATTAADEQRIRAADAGKLSRIGQGNATTASANPPLYYVLQTPVYLMASRGSVLTQLLTMRLLSVFFTSLSVLLAFCFVREIMPRSPWTWTAGGLACAFQPMLGFAGSGVNPDSLLFLTASGTLLAAARILMRGLSTRRSIALALFALAGLLTKPLFLAVIPAVAATFALAALRQRREAARPIAVGVLALLVPMTIYVVAAAGPFGHPYFAVASNVASNATGSGALPTSIGQEVSFILQQYLPRFPLLTDFVPGFPLRDIWINGLVGVFGWVDYQLPISYRDAAMWLLCALLLLAGFALIRARAYTLRFAPIAAVSLLALAGVLGAVAVTDYQAYLSGSPRFQQGRYLLPMLALYAGIFGLAAKGLGPRLSRVTNPALWTLTGFHTFAALVLTASRYYI